MTINPSIDIGQLLVVATIIVSVVGAHFTIRAQVDALKEALTAFGRRLDNHERIVFTLSGELQRVIGTVDADRRSGDDRRQV